MARAVAIPFFLSVGLVWCGCENGKDFPETYSSQVRLELRVSQLRDFSALAEGLKAQGPFRPFVVVEEDEKGILLMMATAMPAAGKEEAPARDAELEFDPLPAISIGKADVRIAGDSYSDAEFKGWISDLAKSAESKRRDIVPFITTHETVSGERGESVIRMLLDESVRNLSFCQESHSL